MSRLASHHRTTVSTRSGSQVMEYCAREARQIFGGNAYTRSGLGEKADPRKNQIR